MDGCVVLRLNNLQMYVRGSMPNPVLLLLLLLLCSDGQYIILAKDGDAVGSLYCKLDPLCHARKKCQFSLGSILVFHSLKNPFRDMAASMDGWMIKERKGYVK